MTQRAVIILLVLGLGIVGYTVMRTGNRTGTIKPNDDCGSCDSRHQRLSRPPND